VAKCKVFGEGIVNNSRVMGMAHRRALWDKLATERGSTLSERCNLDWSYSAEPLILF
jgi:hypothetical protein